jgi:hypothetical protein
VVDFCWCGFDCRPPSTKVARYTCSTRTLSGGNFLTGMLILNDGMMRVAIALVVLFSVLSAPIASAMCRDCCNRSIDDRLPLCHDKAPAHLGPHVHHMNHHVHMVRQDPDATILFQQSEHQVKDGRLSCHSIACLSAKPVQAFVASVSQHQLQFSSWLFAATVGSSLISVRLRPPDSCQLASGSSQSGSVPLRV